MTRASTGWPGCASLAETVCSQLTGMMVPAGMGEGAFAGGPLEAATEWLGGCAEDENPSGKNMREKVSSAAESSRVEEHKIIERGSWTKFGK